MRVWVDMYWCRVFDYRVQVECEFDSSIHYLITLKLSIKYTSAIFEMSKTHDNSNQVKKSRILLDNSFFLNLYFQMLSCEFENPLS